MKSFLTKLLLITFGLIFAFAIDFIASTTYKAINGNSYFKNLASKSRDANHAVFRSAHKIYHHGLKPNVENATSIWGINRYSIHTNSLGFRDQKVRDVLKKTDQRRLILIGDSFLEGPGLHFEETVAGIASAKLKEQNTEVLNAAVNSYSTFIYYKKIEHLIKNIGLDFDDLAVFIDISDCIDDAKHYAFAEDGSVTMPEPNFDEEQSSFKPLQAISPLYRFLSDNSFIFATALFFIETNRYETYLKNYPRTNKTRGTWTVDQEFLQGYGTKCEAVMTKNLGSLLELLRKHDKNLSIIVYPWPDQIVNLDLNSKQVQIWSKWCKENNVPFLNLFPDFIGFPEDTPGELITTEVLDKYFIPGDVHWNQEGSRLIASRFLDFYKNNFN